MVPVDSTSSFIFKINSNFESEIQSLISFYVSVSNNINSDIFKWKHINNIEGPSIIAYAIHKNSNRIVASRALWKQRINYNGADIIAAQPCDTFTHPDFQKLGLFTKLTLLAIEEAKKQNISILCNFPNYNSKPGYLKLNFIDIGGINHFVFVPKHSIIKVLYNFFAKRKDVSVYKHLIKKDKIQVINDISSLDIADKKDMINTISLVVNSSYVNWRFEEHPVHHYYSITKRDAYIVYYIGYRGRIKEARVVFLTISTSNLKILLEEIILKERVDIVTLVCHNDHENIDTIKSYMYKIRTKANFVAFPLNDRIDILNIKWNINSCFIDTF